MQKRKKTTLNEWLYGETEDRDDYKAALFVQIVPQKSIFILIFGALMSYLILVGCGSMGSPNPVKLNKLECGIHNDCSISYSQKF